jgi:hypothetical protein
MRKDEDLSRSYNKYHKLVIRDIVGSTDVSEAQFNFMLFVYDYEFFTTKHISEAYFQSKLKLERRIVYPLQTNGYVYQYYTKLAPTNYEDAIFDEGRYNYRVRYALTQKARLLVQRYYRKLEGLEQINVPT